MQEADKGGLFLGRLDQGPVGREHVTVPKGKATLVPKVGGTAMSKVTYIGVTCDKYAMPGEKTC